MERGKCTTLSVASASHEAIVSTLKAENQELRGQTAELTFARATSAAEISALKADVSQARNELKQLNDIQTAEHSAKKYHFWDNAWARMTLMMLSRPLPRAFGAQVNDALKGQNIMLKRELASTKAKLEELATLSRDLRDEVRDLKKKLREWEEWCEEEEEAGKKGERRRGGWRKRT